MLLSHVFPENGYKKTAVKCSVFTTVYFVFNSILGVTTKEMCIRDRADSVPGVSGGSIAFLMGFYNEFITSLIFYRGRGRKSRWHDNCHG